LSSGNKYKSLIPNQSSLQEYLYFWIKTMVEFANANHGHGEQLNHSWNYYHGLDLDGEDCSKYIGKSLKFLI